MRNLILKTAGAFALLGWLFSSRKFILFLNQLNPFQGLLFYYLQIFLTLEVLQYFGLIIGGVRMTSLTQTLGELMMIFAFFIIVDNESEWIQIVVGENTKEKQNCPKVYLQAEDGATYYLWKTYVTKNEEVLRLLTFVVTPAILVGLGLYLTGGAKLRRELLG
jgi:hypothetical protein